MIEKVDRPEWVNAVIDDLTLIDQTHLTSTLALLIHDQTIVRVVAAAPAVLQEIDEAIHCLAHVEQHIVSMRRMLKMAWPSDRDG